MPIAELLASDWIREMSSSVGCLERSLEYVIATFAPRDARSNARAEPIPREPPVTMALVRGSVNDEPEAISFVWPTLCLPAFEVAMWVPLLFVAMLRYVPK